MYSKVSVGKQDSVSTDAGFLATTVHMLLVPINKGSWFTTGD